MKKYLKRTIFFAGLWLAVSTCLFSQTDNFLENMKDMSFPDRIEFIKNMEISDITAKGIPDGEYFGTFPFGNNFQYKVKVIVKSEAITDIDVVDNGTNNSHAKKGLAVISRIIKKQSPNVDAITGATVTSKALMKCVEFALNRG